MKKKKKETNKLPSIEELYKWAGFWQKIEINTNTFCARRFIQFRIRLKSTCKLIGKCFPVGCFTILHIYFVNKRGLKSNRLLLFPNSQWFILFDFVVNPSVFSQSFRKTSTSEVILSYQNLPSEVIIISSSSSDLNHLSNETWMDIKILVD